MGLISAKDLFLNTGIKKLGVLGRPLAYGLHNLMGLDDLNALYLRNKQFASPTFEKKVLEDLGIRYELFEEDLKRIPKEGPFIVVCNHPLGALDGVILLKVISELRPDFKVIGNFMLHQIEPLQTKVFPVNPFDNRKEMRSSILGMKKAFEHVKEGYGLGIFPAGEVSQRDDDKKIIDRPWQKPVMKMIKKAKVPVIPLYFLARNSELFYHVGKLHPDLQTSMLVREALRTRLRPIKLRIGKPISPNIFEDYASVEDFSDFLRKKTYVLENTFDKKSLKSKIISNIPKIKGKAKPIISPIEVSALEKEIDTLRTLENHHLFTTNSYECFFAPYKTIPHIMKELARLREVSFRAVGEGTNQPYDSDKYDKYYHHLFLWDNKTKKIAGAYRMGLGKEIYKNHGVKGFYINELFNFEPEIQPFFGRSIEMGRAFVTPEYQQKPYPLFLLWKGIFHVALRNPEHKYIVGGVSISNQFSDFGKSLMIEFMRSHYYDPYVAQFVRARKEYKPKLKDQDKDFIFDEAKADLNKFDKLLSELEPNSLRLPVLIKKYIKQNARVIGFNVDPKFNDAIDGLMYIKIADIPDGTMKPVLEEMEKELLSKNKEEKTG